VIGPLDVSTTAFLLLLAIAVFAGWMDALIGGGGLIQVPALLLLAPGIGPAGAVGTSKLAAIMGTGYAVAKFHGLGLIRWRLALVLGGLTALGGAAGSFVLIGLSRDIYSALLLVVLVCCPLGMLLRSRAFRARPAAHDDPGRRPRLPTVVLTGLALGLYDGLVGPGTGTWIIYALGLVVGMSLIEASANAKVVNVFTYVGPLVVLAAAGQVAVVLGLAMGAGNVIGAHYGVRFAKKASDRAMSTLLLLCICILFVSLLAEILR